MSGEALPLPCLSAVKAVTHNLRARDREELAALGHTDFDEVAEGFNQAIGAVFGSNGVPVAVVGFMPVTPSTLSVGLLATDDWPKVARAVLRWAPHMRDRLLALGYRRAECRTLANHEDAVLMLGHLGFELECPVPLFGRDGQDFLQFSYLERSARHLLFQSSQSPASAGHPFAGRLDGGTFEGT